MGAIGIYYFVNIMDKNYEMFLENSDNLVLLLFCFSTLKAGLFCALFLLRRNLLIYLICLEMIMMFLSMEFIIGSVIHGNVAGQIMALFLIALAAVEAALGLAFFVATYRVHKDVSLDTLSNVRKKKKK